MANIVPSNAPGVEALPPHLRQQVVDRLLSGQSSRDVSAYLLQQGQKLSHNSIARYKRRVLVPAIQTGAKLQKLQSVETTGKDQAEQTAALTKQVLTADPIIALWERQQQRIHQGIEKTLSAEEYDARAHAALEAVAAKSYEGTAKSTMHPGWTSAAPTINVDKAIIVFPGQQPAQPQIASGDVIEVEAE